MKRVWKWLAGLFAGTAIAAGVGGCYAWHSASPEQRMEWLVERAAEKLSLTPPQRERLVAVKEELGRIRHEAGIGPEQRHEQVAALIAGERFDRAAAQTLVSEKTRQVERYAPQVVAALGDFYDSLDPQQQQQLRDWLADAGGRHCWH